MKRLIICIAVFMISNLGYAQEIKKPIVVDIGTALTNDNMHWSIAGNLAGKNPNVRSEIIWKNLQGNALTASLQLPLLRKIYLNVSFSKSFIHNGSATDTDYEEDNRTKPVFKATLNSDYGYLASQQFKVGYNFALGDLQFSPTLGYSAHIQHLHLTDSNVPMLNSSYKTVWNGFTMGATLGKTVKKLTINATINYHQINYRAKANWNLISEFEHPVSFKHIAKGFGTTLNATLLYHIKPCIAPFVNFGGCYWSTGKGIDELYKADGETINTILNNVSRNGYNLALGIQITI